MAEEHKKPDPPKTARSLIIGVPEASGPSTARSRRDYTRPLIKTPPWVIIALASAVVVVPVLIQQANTPDTAADISDGSSASVDCLDVGEGFLTVQEAAVDQTVAPVVRRGGIDDEQTQVQVLNDCSVAVIGANLVRRPDGSVHEDRYTGRAIPDLDTSTYRVENLTFVDAAD